MSRSPADCSGRRAPAVMLSLFLAAGSIAATDRAPLAVSPGDTQGFAAVAVPCLTFSAGEIAVAVERALSRFLSENGLPPESAGRFKLPRF